MFSVTVSLVTTVAVAPFSGLVPPSPSSMTPVKSSLVISRLGKTSHAKPDMAHAEIKLWHEEMEGELNGQGQLLSC